MALTDNLVSHWRFDESSGGAADAVGGNNLTNNNSATFGTGKLFNGVDLERGSTQYLNVADNASLSITGDLSFSCWVKPESQPATNTTHVIMSKWVSAGNQRNYRFEYENVSGTTKITAYISDDGTTASSGSINQTLSNATWYHLVFVYDASAGSVEVYVNGSSIGTISGLDTSIADGTGQFQIGTENNGADAPDGLWDGMIDEASLWSRTLTSAEVTSLYNSGSGMYFLDGEFVASADTKNQSLVAYYKLDESSGNASDAHNSNDLTNNNTTAYGTGIINNGADFEDGSSQSLSIADAAQGGLDITGAFSIAAWVKSESQPGAWPDGRMVVSKVSGDSGYELLYWQDAGTYYLDAITGDGSTTKEQVYSSGSPILANATWAHVVMIFSPSSYLDIYLNGTRVLNDTSSLHAAISNNAAAFTVGNRPASTMYFDGLIDEVGVWQRALTSGEVTALYNSGAGAQYPFDGGGSPPATAIKDIISAGIIAYPR